MLPLLCSCAVVSPWRDLVPTGTSGRDGQKLLEIPGVQSQGPAGELWWGLSRGLTFGELGKTVHEGEPLARTCMWLDLLWAGFWAAWKVLDRGGMIHVLLENKPHGRK